MSGFRPEERNIANAVPRKEAFAAEQACTAEKATSRGDEEVDECVFHENAAA